MRSRDSFHDWVDREPVFRRKGDYWTIAYGTAVVRLKDAKGLPYLERLLRQPGQSFHVTELIRLATCPPGLRPEPGEGTAEERPTRWSD